MSTGIAACSPAEAALSRLAALMHADAVLPADVVPGPVAARRQPRTALLTGATGFLGRYAARALLEHTALDLVCLVRGDDDDHARGRIEAALEAVGVSARTIGERVRVVRGDVAMPRFGLHPAAYEALAQRVDRVYHCAAEVNWARSYRQLRPTNVLGALEAIRFACARRAKPLAFVSTIAVCFAEGDAAPVDEASDLLPHVGAMPLGYAQSKCVAERLLRQAAARGLPVTLLRPALISGDSASGEVNLDDLIAALVEGCVRAGAAIDVDWLLDCVPVDFVAAVLARVPPADGRIPQVLHLVHERPRHWRELVLWMNLHGYPVRLLPVRDWLDEAFVRGAVAGTRLYGYRRFFQGMSGHTPRPFEAYLESHQRRVSSAATRERLAALGIGMPALDAPLLHRYFEGYRGAGVLPRLRAGVTASAEGADTRRLLETLLRSRADVAGLRVLAAHERPFASANGILNEISAVRLGRSVGIRRYAVEVTRERARAPLRFDVLLKTKASDEQLKRLTADLAAVCDPQLGRLFERHRDALGLCGSHERELALYEVRDPRLRRHAPRCLGTLRDDDAGRWAVMLEYVAETDTGDLGADPRAWDDARLNAAIDGLAAIQAATEAVRDGPAAATLAAERSTEAITALAPLWTALVDYAAPRFAQWSSAAPSVQHAFIDTLDRWWPALLAFPHTLIHNDFNPRNFTLRATPRGRRLCAFDWELAAFGLPQRDLAELLCFTAGEWAAGAEAVGAMVERHRRALIAAGAVRIDPAAWRAGFVLGLRQFVTTRLPMYALIDRFRPQRFLPDVVRNAVRLHEVTRRWVG